MYKETRQSQVLTSNSDTFKEFSQIFHILHWGKEREVQKNTRDFVREDKYRPEKTEQTQ